MYQLRVMKDGDDKPFETIYLSRSEEVLATIPKLLDQHEDCERIAVFFNSGRLFSVDCKGNRIE
ncbi:MAG: hypothetical protein JWO33_2273 [Caulobacteraceae bacterium]|nr:hypothetical protein [Caulobacteraceae bacterium]